MFSKKSLEIPTVSTNLEQGVRTYPLLRPWLTMIMTELKLLTKKRSVMRFMERFWKGQDSSKARGVTAGIVGWVSILFAWQTAHLEMNF